MNFVYNDLPLGEKKRDGFRRSVTVSEVHLVYIALCVEKSCGQENSAVIGNMSLHLKFTVIVW